MKKDEINKYISKTDDTSDCYYHDISNTIINCINDISNNFYGCTFDKKMLSFIFNYIGIRNNIMYMIDNIDKIKSKYDINKNEIKYFKSQSYNSKNIIEYIMNCKINAPIISEYRNNSDYLYIYLLPFCDPVYKTFIIKIGQTGNMNERYNSHKKSFGYNIELLLVIDTIEIRLERELHKILENLGNKKFVYKHKNDTKSFKECYILCDIVMETVVNKINEVQKTKQMKIDMIIKKAEREQELKQFHIQELEKTKQIEFQENTKQIELQENTKQIELQENTKQIEFQEKTKQLELDVMIRKIECQENTKQMQEKTKQLELQIELIKLQKNSSTIN
jgi:hypothetical protein